MAQPIPQIPVTGTAAELAAFRPAAGQLAHATDTGDWYVGDGAALVADITPAPAGGASSVVVRAFPFAFDTAGLLTGHAVYTPTIGDQVLDAWVRVTTLWDGTDPTFDVGSFVADDGHYGWFGDLHGAIPLNGGLDDNGIGATVGSPGNFAKPASLSASILAETSGGSTANIKSRLPLIFQTADPIKIVVSQNGLDNGADPGSTVGAAVLYLHIATPV